MAVDELPTKIKLNLETAVIKWKDLQVFFAQGKLLVVDNSADLIDSAELLAENAIDSVEQLIASDKISFATIDWVKRYCAEETLVWAVVVSPYVLIQLK